MSTKRKLYASVLGLCAAGLLLDRAILGPSEASADDPAAAAVEEVVVPEADRSAPPGRSAGIGGLAARLDRIVESGAIDPEPGVDAFRPAESWVPPQVSEVVVKAAVVDSSAEGFVAAHELTAVMLGGASSYAIIDGRPLRLGHELDGYTLVEVLAEEVVLERGGAEVRLKLRRDGVASENPA